MSHLSFPPIEVRRTVLIARTETRVYELVIAGDEGMTEERACACAEEHVRAGRVGRPESVAYSYQTRCIEDET